MFVHLTFAKIKVYTKEQRILHVHLVVKFTRDDTPRIAVGIAREIF